MLNVSWMIKRFNMLHLIMKSSSSCLINKSRTINFCSHQRRTKWWLCSLNTNGWIIIGFESQTTRQWPQDLHRLDSDQIISSTWYNWKQTGFLCHISYILFIVVQICACLDCVFIQKWSLVTLPVFSWLLLATRQSKYL